MSSSFAPGVLCYIKHTGKHTTKNQGRIVEIVRLAANEEWTISTSGFAHRFLTYGKKAWVVKGREPLAGTNESGSWVEFFIERPYIEECLVPISGDPTLNLNEDLCAPTSTSTEHQEKALA